MSLPLPESPAEHGAVIIPYTPKARPHVRLIGVSKQLGTLRAVDDVSLDIQKGSMLTLLGPSGCGKSTTLRLLAGFYQPDAGEIFLGEDAITRLPPNQRRMTMVFQEYALFPHLTVAQNVAYGLKMRSEQPAKIKTRVGEMLELVGLSAGADKFPHQLSGGQQQRVALARALAVDPEVLLLDEPLSNLDAKLRVRLREEIVRLQKVLGKTMVFVTHDQEEALSISDEIAVMRDGRIAQRGSPTEIYFRPADRYVAEFIGHANFLEAEVIEPGRVRFGQGHFPMAQARQSGPATLVVRPEAISFAASASSAAGAVPGQVQRRSFQGSVARYWVQTAYGEIIVDDPAPSTLHDGAVQLVFAPERMHLLPQKP